MDYGPISLFTVFNKPITNMLNTKLNLLLPRIIFPQQIGFVHGRLNYVLLTQKLLYTLDDRAHGENTMLKRYDKSV